MRKHGQRLEAIEKNDKNPARSATTSFLLVVDGDKLENLYFFVKNLMGLAIACTN